MTIKNTISPRTQAQTSAPAMVQDPEFQKAMMTLQQLQVGLSQQGIKTVEDFLEKFAKGSELASLLSLQSAHSKIAAQSGSGALAVGQWIDAAIAQITAAGLTSATIGFQDVSSVLQQLDTGLLQVGEATLPQSNEMSQHFDALTSIVTGFIGETAVAPDAAIPTPADVNPQLQSRWSDYVTQHGSALSAIDVNALVQQVLRQSYMETSKDLYFYAEKVKFYNELKKQIREELSRAREFLAGVAGLDANALLEHLFYGKEFNSDFLGADGPIFLEGVSEALQMTLPSGDELILSPEMLENPGLWEAVRAIESRTWGVDPKDYAGGCGGDEVGTLVTSMYYFMAVNNLIQGHQDDYDPQQLVDDLKTNYGIEATVDNDGEHGLNVIMPDGTTFHDSSGNGSLGERDMNFDKALVDLSAAMGFDAVGYDMQAGFDAMSSQGFIEAMKGMMADTGSEYPEDKALAMTMLAFMYSDAGLGTAEAGNGKPIGSKAELETYIENTETLLNTVGDDAQLANVDLQNMLQKQQQTMQMMSNIAKMLHDTTMAIIRKIGG